jgi:thiol-disulfide isomerase/thioredoxin
VRGASALDRLLAEFPNADLSVIAVWEPVLKTDIAAPLTRVLGLLGDRRVAQYWDPGRVVSEDLIRSSNSDPARYGLNEALPPGFVVWDAVLVFARSAHWDHNLPVPVYYGGPFDLGDSSMPHALATFLLVLAAAAGTAPVPIGPLRVGDAEGKTITLDAPGVLYLVDFWALGCKPCIVEMPELERLANEYEPGGRFRLVSVVASGWEGKDLLTVATQAGTKLPISSDPDDLFRQLQITAFPTKLLIRDGKLLIRKRGGGTGAYETWKKVIDSELQRPTEPSSSGATSKTQ